MSEPRPVIYRCRACGSSELEEARRVWFDMNTNVQLHTDDDTDDVYCRGCENYDQGVCAIDKETGACFEVHAEGELCATTALPARRRKP